MRTLLGVGSLFPLVAGVGPASAQPGRTPSACAAAAATQRKQVADACSPGTLGPLSAVGCFACASPGPGVYDTNPEREIERGADSQTAPEDNAMASLQSPTLAVTQAADRSFSPFLTSVLHAGDMITWIFPSPSPGNSVVRRIPVRGAYAIAPYTPTDRNEFAGPMIKAPSGIFVLSPSTYANVEQATPCGAEQDFVAQRTVGATTEYLCKDLSAPSSASLESTWANPSITGVFIRMKWKDFQTSPTTYADAETDFLAQEADRAVAHGKLFSIVLESGRDGQPPWLFATVASGGAGLPGYELLESDDASYAPGEHCEQDDKFTYADPTSTFVAHKGPGSYLDLYKGALTKVAEVLKRKSSRYRALAYIKPSGANRTTGENRLPARCRASAFGATCICNNQVWAAAGFRPSKLYSFYAEQFAHIHTQFPNKSMSFMVVNSGWPSVGEGGCWKDENNAIACPLPLPLPLDQTVPGADVLNYQILVNTFADPDISGPGVFVVSNQALSPTGGHRGPEIAQAVATGRPIMFQTTGEGEVGNPSELGAALVNMVTNTPATAFEMYEERLWQASGSEQTLGGPAPYSDWTVGSWNAELHDRRRRNYASLGDPAPKTYSFVLGSPVIVAPNTFETIRYADPRIQPVTQTGDCRDGFSPCILVQP